MKEQAPSNNLIVAGFVTGLILIMLVIGGTLTASASPSGAPSSAAVQTQK